MSIDLVKNKFDTKEFNAEFTKYMENQKKIEEQQENEKLKKLNQEIYVKKISDMTFQELLIEWKKSLIGIFDDILNRRFDSSNIFGENKLFFAGITIIIIVCLFYFVYWILTDSDKNIVRDEHIFNISLNIPNMDDKKTSFIGSIFKKLHSKKDPIMVHPLSN